MTTNVRYNKQGLLIWQVFCMEIKAPFLRVGNVLLQLERFTHKEEEQLLMSNGISQGTGSNVLEYFYMSDLLAAGLSLGFWVLVVPQGVYLPPIWSSISVIDSSNSQKYTLTSKSTYAAVECSALLLRRVISVDCQELRYQVGNLLQKENVLFVKKNSLGRTLFVIKWKQLTC